MKIGILGSGIVGKTLAGGFLAHGHEAVVGSRDPGKLEEWARQNSGVRCGIPILWCIPGLRHNGWTHAFRLLRS